MVVNYRQVPSSERTPHNNNPQQFKCNFHENERKIGLGVPDGGLTTEQTDRLAVGSKMTLTLILTF
jgi:hypothetical protein